MNLAKTVYALLLAALINETGIAQNTNPWPATGAVGIGTTSPDQLFTVNGLVHIGNDLIMTRTDNVGSGASIVVDNSLCKSLWLQKQGGGHIDAINLLGTSICLNGNTTIGGTSISAGGSKLTVLTNTSGDGLFLSNDGSGYGGSSGFIKMHGPSLFSGAWNGITLNGDAGIVFGTASVIFS